MSGYYDVKDAESDCSIEISTEAVYQDSFAIFEDITIVSASSAEDFAAIKAESDDPNRKYIFKNAKIVNTGAGVNNVCIGTAIAATTDIIITGTTTSNKLAASANLAFGTINNVTSPDLDLITNSNII